MFQTGLQNRSNMDPNIALKLNPNGSKIAPQRWRPGEGAQDRYSSDFGSESGSPKRSNMYRNSSLNQGSPKMLNFVALEASWVALGDNFGLMLGCSLGSRCGKQDF